jgi:hypothetical protein
MTQGGRGSYLILATGLFEYQYLDSPPLLQSTFIDTCDDTGRERELPNIGYWII